MDRSTRCAAALISCSLVCASSTAFADGQALPEPPVIPADPGAPAAPGSPGPYVPYAPPVPHVPHAAPAPAPAVKTPAPPPGTEIQSERRPRYGFVWAGLAVFGAFYLPAAFAGAVQGDNCKSRGCTSPGWPLYIPVAGPFLKTSTAPTEIERFGLVFTGLSQTAGILFIVGGLLSRQTSYFYTPKAAVAVAPMLSPGTTGAMVAGRF